MKNFILASIFISLSGSSYAGSYAKPIAKVVSSGGVCMDSCSATTVTVDSHGQVTVEVQRYQPQTLEQLPPAISYSKLSRSDLHTIRRDAVRVKDSALIDFNPGGPICMGMPEVVYSLIQRSNQIALIGKDSYCHEYRLPHDKASGSVTILKELLTEAFKSAL